MISNDVPLDKALFARVTEGDSLAYKELFIRYYDPLRINAFRLLNNMFWAEEVAQEVFVKVWDLRTTLTGVSQPSSWLYRICTNLALDRIRKQKNEVRAHYFLAQAHNRSPGITEPNSAYDFEQLKKNVAEAIDQLPAQQKIAYMLQLEENLSYLEIAARMELSVNTVRNHLVRATQSVRNYLMQYAPHLLPVLIFLFV